MSDFGAVCLLGYNNKKKYAFYNVFSALNEKIKCILKKRRNLDKPNMAFSTNTIALVAFILAMAFSEPISELTCGHLFYRALYLDDSKDVLYVGAMDRLVKISNLQNISETDCSRDSMILKANSIPNCISRGKSIDYDCRNHIRVIRPIGDGSRLYICGTNAHRYLLTHVFQYSLSLSRESTYRVFHLRMCFLNGLKIS